MNTEISAGWVFFLIENGESVGLVTLTAIFLSNNVGIEWNINRLAASVIFPTSVTVHVVLLSDAWLTNAVIVFVVIGGIVRVS